MLKLLSLLRCMLNNFVFLRGAVGTPLISLLPNFHLVQNYRHKCGAGEYTCAQLKPKHILKLGY